MRKEMEDPIQDQPKWWRSGKEMNEREVDREIWKKTLNKKFETIIPIIEIKSRTNLNGGELEKIWE